MKIYPLCHSGFALESETLLIVFDYWRDPDACLEKLLTQEKNVLYLVSHAHADHWNPEILSLKHGGDRLYLLDETCRSSLVSGLAGTAMSVRQAGAAAENPLVFLQEGDEYPLVPPFANFVKRVFALGSSDEGLSFLLDTAEGFIFHAGDLNDWDWQDEDREANELLFLQKLDDLEARLRLCRERLRLAFFPVDPRLGETALKGASRFIERFRPRVFMAMHSSQAAFRSLLPSYHALAEKHADLRILPIQKVGKALKLSDLVS